MDPNRIVQALKGTIDPGLRIAAEHELNQVRVGFVSAEVRLWGTVRSWSGPGGGNGVGPGDEEPPGSENNSVPV